MLKKFLSTSLLFLCLNISLQAKDNIVIYHAYGNNHHLTVQGRMERKKLLKRVHQDDGWLSNLWRRVKQIQSDEIESTTIHLSINHENFKTKGDDEGYFEFNIKTKQKLTMGYQDILLQIEGNKNPLTAKVTIIDNQPLWGIISDFDDTLIVSNVTDKIDLTINTLFKNYKQRVVVPSMLKRFKKILAQNPQDAPSTLFVLSGSPQQLFTPIEQFLEYHHFPKHTLLLKKVHGENLDPLTDQMAYKTQKIEKLIQLYPKMQWVMFGDSGEKDAEVYKFIQSRYPKKVKHYYIRNVKSGEIKIDSLKSSQ